MTSSPNDVRKGSQQPRLESYPLFHTSAGDDAMDMAALVGLDMDPWQEHVLRASLGERPDGRWSAFRTCLVVPRQNGKNAILEARELAGLFLFGEELIIHTAHQFKTANKSMLTLMNRIKKIPDLMEQIDGFDGDLTKNIRQIDGFKTGNSPGIYLKNGRSLQYAARSGDSGRGFTGNLVILDEAYALKSSEMGALLPTMAATSMDGNPQVWITSSAGQVDSDYLAALREQGINKTSDRLAYFEWSADETADMNDVDAWYQANPALGYRISEEFVRDELESMEVDPEQGPEEFKRERLGIWAKVGGDSAIPDAEWAACRGDAEENELLAKSIGRVAFGVDIPPSRDSATISMAGDLGDGRFTVVVIDRREGTAWVPERLGELKEKWNPVAVVLDDMAATGTLVPEIRRNKVRPLLVKTRELGMACAKFYDAVVTALPDQDDVPEKERVRVLSHSGQKELTDAVASAQRKSMGSDSVWKWARSGTADIAPLISGTLALYGAQRIKKKDPSGSGSQKMIMMGR